MRAPWDQKAKGVAGEHALADFVPHLRLAFLDEAEHLGVDRIVQFRRGVIGQHLLPALVGPLVEGFGTVIAPLLEAVVVAKFAPLECGFEVAKGVLVPEEVLPMFV